LPTAGHPSAAIARKFPCTLEASDPRFAQWRVSVQHCLAPVRRLPEVRRTDSWAASGKAMTATPLAAIPARWCITRLLQLRTLREEVVRQKDFPTSGRASSRRAPLNMSACRPIT
jgi:hypothetical protein